MYGSTPRSPISGLYSYYVSRAKPLDGKRVRIRCEAVDEQIGKLLQGVAVSSDHLPAIKEIYQSQIREEVESDLDKTSEQMSQKLAKMQSQQTQLTRLFLEGVIGEDEYKQLRAEWQEKLRYQRMRLAEAKRDISKFIDDLDMALALLEHLPNLYERLAEDDKNQLLRILLNRIIVDNDGEIIEYELNAPFTYLTTLLKGPKQGTTGTFSRSVQHSPHPICKKRAISGRDGPSRYTLLG